MGEDVHVALGVGLRVLIRRGNQGRYDPVVRDNLEGELAISLVLVTLVLADSTSGLCLVVRQNFSQDQIGLELVTRLRASYADRVSVVAQLSRGNARSVSARDDNACGRVNGMCMSDRCELIFTDSYTTLVL